VKRGSKKSCSSEKNAVVNIYDLKDKFRECKELSFESENEK